MAHDRKTDSHPHDESDERPVSRRNFLLGRIRSDSRDRAEEAWRGAATQARVRDSDAPERPLPSVISWLENSLEESNDPSRSRGLAAWRGSRSRPDSDRAFPLLRPPGALAEPEFLEACTRCGDCIEACQPRAIRAAPPRLRAAVDTPIIDPSLAPCLLCEDLPCIDACEPGALRPEAPSSLGTAHVQAFDCLNRLGTSCSVCVERCPVPGALTWVNDVPAVDAALCTGCGQCHYACPAPSNAIAIHPNAARPTSDALEARTVIARDTSADGEADMTDAGADATSEVESLDAPIELPELQDEIVDDEVVARLFRDLGALTRVIEIQEKGAARNHAERLEPDLGEAAARYAAREVRALQIVYVHDDETWCDTLIRQTEGTRVLRMKAPSRATGHG